jgi:hypothetical protein
MVHPSKKET